MVEEIATAQSTIDLLLPQGDFAGALDVLDSMRATCEAHPVTGLHAFQHLSTQITDIAEASSLQAQISLCILPCIVYLVSAHYLITLYSVRQESSCQWLKRSCLHDLKIMQAIDSLLSSDFIRAIQFLHQPGLIARVASAISTHPDAHPTLPALEAEEEEEGLITLEDELTPLVLGLKRTGHLSAAIRLMRSAAAEEVKAGIRQGFSAEYLLHRHYHPHVSSAPL